MRSGVIARAAGAVALVAGILIDAGVASAHRPSYELSCNGATIRASAYESQDTNTATIEIDGVQVFSAAFTTSIEESVAIPQDGAVHSVRFVIDVDRANLDPPPPGWELDVTENVGPCGSPPSSSTTTTTSVPDSSTSSTTTSVPDDSSTTSAPTTSTVPDPLSIAAYSPVCLRDAPYVDVTFGDQPEFNGQEATVTFIDIDGNVVETHTVTYQAGATARFVYPGAEVDSSGNPVDWPGWRWDGDEWVIDPTDSRLRDGLTVVVEVNPTARGMVQYPPATPDCDANPPTSTGGSTTTPLTGTLPATGNPSGSTAMLAAAILAAGALLVAVTRGARPAKK